MSATENTDLHGETDPASLRRLIAGIRVLADELNALCGTDTNVVRPCALAEDLNQFENETGLEASHPLLQFYSLADGLTLMDCFNGVAIHPIERVLAGVSEGHVPQTIGDLRCVCFGSTGGGDLFCITRNSGEVIRLTEVAVEGGKANAGDWQVRTVARDMAEFMRRVRDDLNACLENREAHEYLSSP